MLRFCGWHSKGCERATRAIGGVQSSMRATTVIMRYCDQPASRVGIWLVCIINHCNQSPSLVFSFSMISSPVVHVVTWACGIILSFSLALSSRALSKEWPFLGVGQFQLCYLAQSDTHNYESPWKRQVIGRKPQNGAEVVCAITAVSNEVVGHPLLPSLPDVLLDDLSLAYFPITHGQGNYLELLMSPFVFG